MGAKRDRRIHAARVATVATAVVLAGYIVVVVVLNLVVVHRLTSQADARVADQLADAAGPTLQLSGGDTAPSDQDQDIDDAPTFVWRVTSSGTAVPVSAGAPSLPRRQWSTGLTTLRIGGTPFRFQAVEKGRGFLVAGESMAQLDRVRSALLGPETLLGLGLVLVVFGGSLVIGLRASAPLEEIHRRQMEFTADASHELRTPLSVIEAEVSLSLSRPRSHEEYRSALERIGGEGDRLRRIVEDLLWLARIDDDGSRDHTIGLADVGDLAAQCMARFQALAVARGVSLRSEVGPGSPHLVSAEPEWVDRLVGVLVDNACRYAGVGGSVEVRVFSAAGRVVLQVDDSGPGIPEAQRGVVFDRFHRGSEGGGGTGLGLAIADSVVRASDGAWALGQSPTGGARMAVSWRRVPHRRPPGAVEGGSADALGNP